MGLFKLFYEFLFGFPYCSNSYKRMPANLYYDKKYYDGEVCPGSYYLRIPEKN